MGRTEMTERMVQVTVMYPKDVLAQIDTIRGDVSRSEWFRRAAEEVAYRPRVTINYDPGCLKEELACRYAFAVRTEDEAAAEYTCAEAMLNALLSDGAKGA